MFVQPRTSSEEGHNDGRLMTSIIGGNRKAEDQESSTNINNLTQPRQTGIDEIVDRVPPTVLKILIVQLNTLLPTSVHRSSPDFPRFDKLEDSVSGSHVLASLFTILNDVSITPAFDDPIH